MVESQWTDGFPWIVFMSIGSFYIRGYVIVHREMFVSVNMDNLSDNLSDDNFHVF